MVKSQDQIPRSNNIFRDFPIIVSKNYAKRLKEMSLIYNMEKMSEKFPRSNVKRLKETSFIYNMDKVSEKI